MLKLKLQYFGHLMRRVDSLEKTLMLGGIGSRRRRVRQTERLWDLVSFLRLPSVQLQECNLPPCLPPDSSQGTWYLRSPTLGPGFCLLASGTLLFLIRTIATDLSHSLI